MADIDLDQVLKDIESLKRSVRNNSPLLKAVASSRVFAWLSLPFGVFLIVFCVGTHFLLAARGDWDALPEGWKALLWVSLGIYMVGAGIVKVAYVGKKAMSFGRGSTFWTVVRVMYGGPWRHVSLPALVAMVVASFFAVWIGKPAYVIPVTTVFFAFASNGLGAMVGRPEYFAAGWYALASGLLALFFFESAPWLWTAVTYGGMLLAFGGVGVLAGKGRRGSAPDAEG